MKIVGWDVGRHAHCNSCRAIEQQLWNPCRQHRWLLLRAIEVVSEINGLSLDIFQQAVRRKCLQPRFGVSHGCWWIVVHRTEIAMPINQGHRHRKVLGHAHQGVVHRRIPMRMVFTKHFADDTRTLAIGPVTGEPQLVHRVENAAMYWFEPITRIWQRATDDHTHRVLQIGARHFVSQISLNDPIVRIAGTA